MLSSVTAGLVFCHLLLETYRLSVIEGTNPLERKLRVWEEAAESAEVPSSRLLQLTTDPGSAGLHGGFVLFSIN